MRTAATERAITEYIGPRHVGGRYSSGYWGDEYTVLAIDREPADGSLWSITEATDEEMRRNASRTHCTAWDPRKDRVISQPAGVTS